MSSILSVVCHEPSGAKELHVRLLVFTRENLALFYEKASAFPVLFGRPLRDMKDFLSYVLLENMSGDPEPAGVYYGVYDAETLVGIFFMDRITPYEADVHYSFFDRRHRGREILVREMLRYVFHEYNFVRLNVQIPAYAGMGPRKFIEKCGFRIEGRKRDACFWRNEFFDVHCYGILKGEV